MSFVRERAARTAVLLGLAGMMLSASSANAHPFTPVTLDSRSAASPVVAQTEERLPNGVWHIVHVAGTVSYYAQSLWTLPPAGSDLNTRVVCGTPESSAMFPSSEANGPVGADAEMIFARPAVSARRCQSPVLPARWSNFQMSALKKDGFSDPTPWKGAVDRPASDHTYTYVVKTKGFPIRFRLSDTPASDNYGQLRITGRHGEPEDCTTYGHRTFDYATRKACERGLSAG